MLNFKHIHGTNMLSIKYRGMSLDYEITAAITEILNTGELQPLPVGFTAPSLTLIGETSKGWKILTGTRLREAKNLAIAMGNGMMLITPSPINYAELERRGDFHTLLVPHRSKPSSTYDPED